MKVRTNRKFIGILLWIAMTLCFWQGEPGLSWSSCDLTVPGCEETDPDLAQMQIQASARICVTPEQDLGTYFKVTLENVPLGNPIDDGIFPGWCVEKEQVIRTTDFNWTDFGGNLYDTPIYSSLAPPVLSIPPPNIEHRTWSSINWILNSPTGNDGTKWAVTQLAIWFLVDGTTTPPPAPWPANCPLEGLALQNAIEEAALLADDARENYDFVPGPGQDVALILPPTGASFDNSPDSCTDRVPDPLFPEGSPTQLVIIETKCPGECQECKDGVSKLTLRYDGPDGAQIALESETVVFGPQAVYNGELITIIGDTSDGTFKNDIKVFINGVENGKIHTSCSKPIGPGAVVGVFTVIEAFNKDGSEICPVPPCDECKGGVTRLTLENTGADKNIKIESKKVVFDAFVGAGASFTFFGDKTDGKFEENDLKVYFDGQLQDQTIHVSCSQPINPGVVFANLELKVLASASKDNQNNICPLPGDGECQECKDGVSKLTLRYDGPDAQIALKSETVVFGPQAVYNGELITIIGDTSDGTFKNDIKVFINGVENGKIHTSCSKPIGPGAVVGVFTVIEAFNKDGSEICPVPPCDECKGGVTRLTFENTGADKNIKIESKKVVFDAFVGAGASFTFFGDKTDGKFEENDLKVYFDGQLQDQTIHVSCSQPINPGVVFANLELKVLASASKDNQNNICPLPGDGECQECKDGVSKLTLRYDGPDAQIALESETVVFGPQAVYNGELITIIGDTSDGTFKNDIKVFINGVENGKIHTSCSKPIGPGAVVGVFTVIEAFNKDGSEICPVPPCDECKGGVTRLTLENTGADKNIKIESKKVVFDAFVGAGASFTFFGDKTDGKFEENDLKVYFDGQLQDQTIHVSCSQPINPGVVFANLELKVLASASKDNQNNICPLPPPQVGISCDDGKPQKLVMLNTGEDCSATSHSQDPSKVSCSNYLPFPVSVFIKAGEKENPFDPAAGKWFAGSVSLGDTFTIDATKGGSSKLASNTWVHALDDDDNVVQSVLFHTSCSQPLMVGNQFGAFRLDQFIPEP